MSEAAHFGLVMANDPHTELCPSTSLCLQRIFNWSVCECKVPACFKSAIFIPVPKKSNVSCLDNYRPVALTSIAMKVFERVVCEQLCVVCCVLWQVVKMGNLFSNSTTLSTGAPQRWVLSPLLHSLYTNDFVSHSDNVKIATL